MECPNKPCFDNLPNLGEENSLHFTMLSIAERTTDAQAILAESGVASYIGAQNRHNFCGSFEKFAARLSKSRYVTGYSTNTPNLER